MLPKKRASINVSIQPTKFKKKALCVENKVQKTIGTVYSPTCRTEKFVHISTSFSTFYDCKKYKTCCHVLNFLPNDQKLTIFLFGGNGTHCFAKETSGHYKKRRTISTFEEVSSPFTIKHT